MNSVIHITELSANSYVPTLIREILNKNTKGAKKGKANEKQQLLTKKFDITRRPRSLEHNDIMLTVFTAS